MAASAKALRGLTAAELAAACVELQQHRDAVVQEAIPLAVPTGADDLLLVLAARDAGRAKVFLHLVPGGTRARIALTATRYPTTAFARGPARDLLQKELAGARLVHVAAAAGERRCALHFATANGDRRLVVELFGARGLWALLDAEGRALVLSRTVETAVRTLRLHDPYSPPPPSTEPRGDEPPPRFAAPVLAAIDAHFRPLDLYAEGRAEHEGLVRAATRALQKAKAKAQGIGQQLADTTRAQSYRDRADLMLAYAHTVPRGAASMRVPDPERDGEERSLELDPSKPVVVQAKALYDKARALDDGRAMAERRLGEAEAELATLQPLVDALATIPPDAGDLVERLAP
ncbi:MAG: NFACT family protein, partial [Planctomycetes bacterium]|nr:NFACT family protein [Planctomycetota bacterium]